MTTAELAYIAGIVDGEGCICIAQTYRKRKNFLEQWLQVQIKMVDGQAIKLINKFYPASLTRQKKTAKPTIHPCWCYITQALRAQRFLKDLLPYLRVKRKQAEFGIQFQDTKQDNHKLRNFGVSTLTPAIFQERNKIKKEISDLNQHREMEK